MVIERSIHHRRRWFYALWCALLVASGVALALWIMPERSGTSRLTLLLRVEKLPPLTQVRVWAGPRSRWPGAAWVGQGAVTEIRATDEKVVMVALPLPVATRRWVKDIIPGRTADLVVLQFEAPGQQARYLALPLAQDFRSGILAPGRRMTLVMECGWERLGTDPAGFSELD